MSDTSSLNGIFKRNYNTGSDVFEEQQNLNAKTFSKIPVSSLKPTPQGIYSAVSMTGNELGSAINENQTFENPESYNPQQPFITSKLVVWPWVITGSAIELSETNKQAFATSLDAQMQDNLARINSDLNRQCLGKGTGQLSLANGGATSTSLVVDNFIPFRRGMKIDAYATIGGAKEINGATITAVNPNTSTLTLNSTQTWSDNAVIVKHTVQDGAPTGGKELTGFQAICDTTTYSSTFEGLSVAANPEWVGNVVSAGTAPVSQDLLQKAANYGFIVGGASGTYLISNVGQQRVYLNEQLQKTRYEPAVVKGGHTVLKWNDMEWMVDKDYDLNEIGMYDMSRIERFETRNVHVAELTGNQLYQVVGSDQIGGYYRYQGNTGTWKRNAHTRLINLTEPAFA